MALYGYWTATNEKFLLGKRTMNYVRATVFDQRNNDSSPNPQPMKKNQPVKNLETYKRSWNNILPNWRKNFVLQNIKFTFVFSFHLFYNLKPSCLICLLRKYEPLKQNRLFF